MIEVERKFTVGGDDEKRLLEGADFLLEKTLMDVYYDTPDYALSTKDMWLRTRDGRWELKVPLMERTGVRRAMDQYDELEDEVKIRAAIGFPEGGNMGEDLRARGYAPFCAIETVRRKYRKGEFTIDMDTAKIWGDIPGSSGREPELVYAIGEIELMVNAKEEIADAYEKILAFADAHHLAPAPTRGKGVEYLKRKKPEHYQALVRAGVVVE